MRSVNKPTPDLSSILQKKQQERLAKPLLGILIFSLLVGLIYSGLQFALPWHWQLFLRWLVRGGDVKSIPTSLYQELSILCYTASSSGHVSGYQGTPQIAYSLGKFECKPSPYEDRWMIHDIYGFDSTREAMKGSPVAAILIKLTGQNYTYRIDASIPKKINLN